MERGGCVYILTNKNKTVLYIGVTADLPARLQEHKEGIYSGSFSKRYNLHFLIYFEYYPSIEEAIGREKELKGWTRSKKENLIYNVNPKWEDWSNRDDL